MNTLFILAWFVKLSAALCATMAIHRIVRQGIGEVKKVCWKAKSLSYFFLIGVMMTGVSPLFRMQDHTLAGIISEMSHIVMGIGTIGISIVFLTVRTFESEVVRFKKTNGSTNGSKTHAIAS